MIRGYSGEPYARVLADGIGAGQPALARALPQRRPLRPGGGAQGDRRQGRAALEGDLAHGPVRVARPPLPLDGQDGAAGGARPERQDQGLRLAHPDRGRQPRAARSPGRCSGPRRPRAGRRWAPCSCSRGSPSLPSSSCCSCAAGGARPWRRGDPGAHPRRRLRAGRRRPRERACGARGDGARARRHSSTPPRVRSCCGSASRSRSPSGRCASTTHAGARSRPAPRRTRAATTGRSPCRFGRDCPTAATP